MTSKVLNLTPHDIVLFDNGSNVISNFPKCGQEIRLISEPQAYEQTGLHSNITVVSAQKWSDISDDSVKIGDDVTHLLVSMPVGNFLASNPIKKYYKYWILGPDTGPSAVVRNESGQIIGTRRLVCYAKPF